MVMKAMKLTVVLVGILAVTRYLPVYYNSMEFNNFVKEEIERGRPGRSVKQVLLNQARSYSLPVSEDDIVVTRQGSVMRVDIDYKVPVDLFVVSPELQFHVIGSGLIRD
jgi:hypothetical protein